MKPQKSPAIALLAIIIKFFDDNIVRKELVSLESLPYKTTGQKICNVVFELFDKLRIDTTNIVLITTNGAQNMFSKKKWV